MDKEYSNINDRLKIEEFRQIASEIPKAFNVAHYYILYAFTITVILTGLQFVLILPLTEIYTSFILTWVNFAAISYCFYAYRLHYINLINKRIYLALFYDRNHETNWNFQNHFGSMDYSTRFGKVSFTMFILVLYNTFGFQLIAILKNFSILQLFDIDLLPLIFFSVLSGLFMLIIFFSTNFRNVNNFYTVRNKLEQRWIYIQDSFSDKDQILVKETSISQEYTRVGFEKALRETLVKKSIDTVPPSLGFGNFTSFKPLAKSFHIKDKTFVNKMIKDVAIQYGIAGDISSYQIYFNHVHVKQNLDNKEKIKESHQLWLSINSNN